MMMNCVAYRDGIRVADVPVAEVGQLVGQFESAAPLIEIMAGDPSIRGLTGALETGLAGVTRTGVDPRQVDHEGERKATAGAESSASRATPAW